MFFRPQHGESFCPAGGSSEISDTLFGQTPQTEKTGRFRSPEWPGIVAEDRR
jgi:hypothetical protein